MTAELVEQILVRTVAFAVVSSVSLAVYLVALRFVAWVLVPASALPHVHWWKRHARAFLLISLMITAGALAGLIILAFLN